MNFTRTVLLLSLLGGFGSVFPSPSAADTAALPLDSGGTTRAFFLCDLANGELLHVDRPDRDPDVLAYSRLPRNIFQEIGRPTQAAPRGEIWLSPLYDNDRSVRDAILVESSTGFAAYLEKTGKNDDLGELKTSVGRPFDGVAAADGNFSLIMHRNGSGRTVGAWLFHAGTGRAQYHPSLAEKETSPQTLEISGLPQIAAAHAAVSVLDDEGATVAALVLDPSTGAIHRLDMGGGDSSRLSPRTLEANLWSVFDAAVGWRAFRAIGLEDADRVTSGALIFDPADGKAAFLIGTGNNARLVASTADLAPAFAGDGAPAIVANRQRGQTVGVWILDSSQRSGYYMASPTPGNLTLRPVRFTRR